MRPSHERNTSSPLAALVLAFAATGALAAGAPQLERPSSEVVAEAKAIVEAMVAGERGPYSRIRWYCADGTVHPAQPPPCATRGGGVQHAEYSTARARLAELGWHVGTIFTALTWEELWDGARSPRLRELPLERYLVDVDEGWIMRRARYYRGHAQVENEEEAGRALLMQLLAQREWVRHNFLAAREAVRVIPHHGGGDRTREVRRGSQDIALRDRSFEPLRIKIHSSPGPDDPGAVRAWAEEARRRGTEAEIVAAADALAADLDALYGDAGRAERIATARQALHRLGAASAVDAALAELESATPPERLLRLAAAMHAARGAVLGASIEPAASLALVDLSVALEPDAVRAAFEVAGDRMASRRSLLLACRHAAEAAHGAGLLSEGEHRSLVAEIDRIVGADVVSTRSYREAARALERAGTWALGAVRHAFAEPLMRWTALEPKAARFPDDLLRGSALLPLAAAASRLSRDAEALLALPHVVFGRPASGLAGLNPGVAVGRLHVVTEQELSSGAALRADDIVVLPQTVSELTPVAGILSASEGNVLSHVQLLARNLGIPNVSVPPTSLRTLVAQDGQTVMLAVATDGSTVIERVDALPGGVAELLATRDASEIVAQVDAPQPDLSVTRPLPLSELHAGLSGRVVGPKAANLGELARHFPGLVAPAIAIPFGVFAQHATAGPDPPKARLDRAFALRRARAIDDAALAAEVELVRQSVEALRVSATTRAELEPMMLASFGIPGTYGVFVRSDTNVEDLPQFTGAGLNRTVPHVVGLEQQLAAVPKVWASPFTARAMAWRARALTRPEEVFPSVLLMKSVPSDKSGVLLTADVATGGEGITVAMAWGVGGAVDGEIAETLVLRDDGSEVLASQAKAPFARRLMATGGVDWVPSEMGPVLTQREKQAVRALAGLARQRLAPALGPDGLPLPWDIELGFVAGELALFQVRPLVERGGTRADRIVAAMGRDARVPILEVSLGEPAGGLATN